MISIEQIDLALAWADQRQEHPLNEWMLHNKREVLQLARLGAAGFERIPEALPEVRFLDSCTPAQIIHTVRNIPPGRSLTVLRTCLLHVDAPHPWTPADWILENIPGASLEYWCLEEPLTSTVTFGRLEKPLESENRLRTYVPPSQRHLFQHQPNGLYAPKDLP